MRAITGSLLLGLLLLAPVARAEQAPPPLPDEPVVEPAEPAAPAAPAAPIVPGEDEPAVNDGPWPPADIPSEPPAGSRVDSVDDFVEPLAPYGKWTDLEGQGRVWIPDQSSVSADFRPYGEGRWTQTEYGWTWVSDYDWGWAPFHYGRWVTCDSPVGWAWVPGTVWSPAWVHWRWGNGYIGWSTYGRHSGYRGWGFVPAAHFTSTGVRRHYVPAGRMPGVYHGARGTSDRPRLPGRYVATVPGPSPGAVRRQGGARVARTPAHGLGRLRAPSGTQARVAGRRTGGARVAGRSHAAGQPSYRISRPLAVHPSYRGFYRPGYRAPASRAPAYRAPYRAPAYRAPAYRRPSYSRPSYSRPSYSRPSYSRPSYSSSRSGSSRSYGGSVRGGSRRR